MKDFIKQNMSSVINWLLTLGWMAIVFYLWQYSGIKKPDELNAVGDFLAGVFAPDPSQNNGQHVPLKIT